MHSLFLRLAVASMALTLTSCSTSEGPLEKVPPRRVSEVSMGEQTMTVVHQGTRTPGVPAVILQSGLGKDHHSWTTVMDGLPKNVLAVAPDRPGYGASPEGIAPRDACTIATEQRALLQRAGVAPPYLLVGHSLGGSYQYAFARMYPDEVAGLILLDPTHEKLAAVMRRQEPSMSVLLNAASAVFFTNTMKQEFDAQSQCYDNLPPWSNTVPTALLAPTRSPSYLGDGMQRILAELRADWAAKTGAQYVAVPESGHDIPVQAPGAVVHAIESMLTRPSSNAKHEQSGRP